MPEPKPARTRTRPRTAEGPAVKTTIRLSPIELTLLNAEAALQGVSASEVVRQALVARGILPGASGS